MTIELHRLRSRGALAAAVLIGLAACSGSGLQDDAAPEPAPTAVEVAQDDATVESLPFAADEAAEQTTSAGPVELTAIPAYGIQLLWATRADAGLEIQSANGDGQVVVRTPALEIGQSPDEAKVIDGFVRLADATVVVSMVSADGNAELLAIGPGADGAATVIGQGTDPALDESSTLLVHLDGAEIVGRDVGTWQERFRHPIRNEAQAMDLHPTGEHALLVRDGDVTTIDLDSGFTDTLDRAAGVEYTAATWLANGSIAVASMPVDAAGSDAESDSVVGDAEVDAAVATVVHFDADRRVVGQVELAADAIDIDYDSSGEWLLYVDGDGQLRWLGANTAGIITAGDFVTASW